MNDQIYLLNAEEEAAFEDFIKGEAAFDVSKLFNNLLRSALTTLRGLASLGPSARRFI